MKGQILLIDDNVLDLKIVSAVLEREGYACYGFTDFKEALTWLNENKPNIVFLDIQMPTLSGYDLIPKIKNHENAKECSIIMMSGKNQIEDVKKALLLGAVDYIVKPVDPLVLQQKMKKDESKNESYAEIEVPDSFLKSVHIAEKVKILAISEFGIRAISHIKANPGDSIEFGGLPEDVFGIPTLMARCLSMTVEPGGKHYRMQFTFVGITEAQRQLLRKYCRFLYIKSKSEVA